MSIQKYVSGVKTIYWNNKLVYDKLADLSNLNVFFNPDNLEKVKNQLGDKADKFSIDNFTATADSCSFTIAQAGQITLNVIEREEPKTIKIQSQAGIPGNFTLWIQLLPVDENSCKTRLTLHADLNMMMRSLLGKKLKKGIDQFADGLAKIPFGNI